MKGQETGEISAAKMTGSMITIEQYGSQKLLTGKNPEIFGEHKSEADRGYARAMELIRENRFGIIVLDEILNLLNFN
jgi:ATP:corrinoid adenosyltransferase